MSFNNPPSSPITEEVLKKPGLLDSFAGKVRIATLCLLGIAGCATTPNVQVNHAPKNNVKQESTIIVPDKKEDEEDDNLEKKRNNNKTRRTRGYEERRERPCDEIKLTKPGACVMV